MWEDITIIDIISIIISVCALISSVYVGIRQVKISKMQVDFQNKVELYLLAGQYTIHDADNVIPDRIVPAIFVRNLGNNVIYLEKYVFNGRTYPLGEEVLPPLSKYDGFRYIDLPTDGTPHVSINVYFRDWQKKLWQVDGYADFRDGKWEVTYSPCKKR